jgi:hypothetical protein
LWIEVINITNYLVKKLPTQMNQGMTPLQVFNGRKPHLRHFCIFGCEAHVHVPHENQTKLETKSIRCALVGYDEQTKAYMLSNLETKKVQLNRDVWFNEEKISFTKEEGK